MGRATNETGESRCDLADGSSRAQDDSSCTETIRSTSTDAYAFGAELLHRFIFDPAGLSPSPFAPQPFGQFDLGFHGRHSFPILTVDSCVVGEGYRHQAFRPRSPGGLVHFPAGRGGPLGRTARAGPAWARQAMGGAGRSSRAPMLREFAVGAWAAKAGHFDRSGRGIRWPDGKQTTRVKLGNFRSCLAFVRGANQPASCNSSFRNDPFVLAAFLFVERSQVVFARGSLPEKRGLVGGRVFDRPIATRKTVAPVSPRS